MGAAWEFRLRPDALAWRTGRQRRARPLWAHHPRAAVVSAGDDAIAALRHRDLAGDGPRLLIASTSWRGAARAGGAGRGLRRLRPRAAPAHRRRRRAGRVRRRLAGPALLAGAGGFRRRRAGARGAHGARAADRRLRRRRLVGGFLALFLWQSGNYFWRNRPAAIGRRRCRRIWCRSSDRSGRRAGAGTSGTVGQKR